MKCIKLKILLVFLILILSIGMVSASEAVSQDSNATNGNEHLTNQVSTDVDLLSDSENPATFTDLDNDIKNAENGIVTLTKDYKYVSGKDSNSLRSGIQVENLIINGNNHTIDGNYLARAFTQYSGSVTLNDINFINGYVSGDSNGGAYLLGTGTLTVNNCKFENNFAGRHGGAIGVTSTNQNNNINVYNSTFTNNSARFNGGSLYANKLVVEDSQFEKNRILARLSSEYTNIDQKGLGGAIFARESSIKKSLFNNNRVLNSGDYQIEEGGGAIASIKKLTVDECVFDTNFALKGGAIFGISERESDLVASNYILINNSRFIYNDADSGGAICSNFNATVDNCVFDSNTASGYGGGAISTGFKSNNNVFENSNFTNNVAFNYGGAISSSHSLVKNCIFDNNEANHGGAIFSLSFSVEDSKFTNNRATLGNETIVVVDALTKDDKTVIPDNEISVFDQHTVKDYSRDVLNGNPARTKYIPNGNYGGYNVYCIEQHLFYPDNTEGVLVTDLTYISNSLDRTVVGEYIRIMFYLLDAYPDKYSSYTDDHIQNSIWTFTDGNYMTSRDLLVRDTIKAYNEGSIQFNGTRYILPNGTEMEYDMQIFLTPTDRQNMVLFKSWPFVPKYNETVIKQTINETVLVGENVQFRITVVNTGNMVLDNVFVNDTQYSKGLVYKKWFSEKGDWILKGKGFWVLNHDLEPGENASFIIVFSTNVLGTLTNNVTSGYRNITLSNSTNRTKTLANPSMTVEKISNDVKVEIGHEVSFDIIVRNTGKYDITGVYVVEDYYSKGLKYDYFVDRSNSWRYIAGENRWDYTKVLGVGESAKFTVFFLTTRTGVLFNTVTAGNNQTDKTVNATNKTTVIHKNKTVPDKPKKNDTNETKRFKHYHKVEDRNATGNPLYALVLVLISLGVITFKRRK